MRLKPDEIEAIKAATMEAFGPNAVVRLFGSRVYDDLQGGDLDLHVEVEPRADAESRLSDLRTLLWRRLDYEKIDLLMSQRGGIPRGFERLAYRDGVIL